MGTTFRALVSALLLAGCAGEIVGEEAEITADAAPGDKPKPDAAVPEAPDARVPDARVASIDAAPSGECPEHMTPVGDACMDLYEAPGVPGALPLVMYTFTESEAWCQAHGKRLCYDDEWQKACEGDAKWAYPYGPTRVPGKCNDNKVWKVYTQSLLNGWPKVSLPGVATLAELYAAARATGAAGTLAANHVEALYQGEGGGAYPECKGAAGVFDLTGSVEEWTRRRDGGEPQFHGTLKGRYWAETRTCQNGVKTHGDAFRFYEIGFRCCVD